MVTVALQELSGRMEIAEETDNLRHWLMVQVETVQLADQEAAVAMEDRQVLAESVEMVVVVLSRAWWENRVMQGGKVEQGPGGAVGIQVPMGSMPCRRPGPLQQ